MAHVVYGDDTQAVFQLASDVSSGELSPVFSILHPLLSQVFGLVHPPAYAAPQGAQISTLCGRGNSFALKKNIRVPALFFSQLFFLAGLMHGMH